MHEAAHQLEALLGEVRPTRAGIEGTLTWRDVLKYGLGGTRIGWRQLGGSTFPMSIRTLDLPFSRSMDE